VVLAAKKIAPASQMDLRAQAKAIQADDAHARDNVRRRRAGRFGQGMGKISFGLRVKTLPMSGAYISSNATCCDLRQRRHA